MSMFCCFSSNRIYESLDMVSLYWKDIKGLFCFFFSFMVQRPFMTMEQGVVALPCCSSRSEGLITTQQIYLIFYCLTGYNRREVIPQLTVAKLEVLFGWSHKGVKKLSSDLAKYFTSISIKLKCIFYSLAILGFRKDIWQYVISVLHGNLVLPPLLYTKGHNVKGKMRQMQLHSSQDLKTFHIGETMSSLCHERLNPLHFFFQYLPFFPTFSIFSVIRGQMDLGIFMCMQRIFSASEAVNWSVLAYAYTYTWKNNIPWN